MSLCRRHFSISPNCSKRKMEASPRPASLPKKPWTIRKTLDPGAAQIWKIYKDLARIADQERKPERAAEYRRLERDAKRAFAGTAHEMRRHLRVILGTYLATQDPEKAGEFDSELSAMEEHGWTNLVGAIRRILAGERTRDALCDKLDLEDFMIVETILEALENPAILQEMLPAGEGASA